MFLRNYIDRFVAKKSKVPKKRNRIFDNDNYNAREHSAPSSAPKWTRAGYNGKLEHIITEACKEESDNNSDQETQRTQGEDSSEQETQENSSEQETQGEDCSDQETQREDSSDQETQREDSSDQETQRENSSDQENESYALSSLRLAYDSDGNTADIESESEEEIVLLTSEGWKKADDSDELEMDD
jgi:hypothetical protein